MIHNSNSNPNSGAPASNGTGLMPLDMPDDRQQSAPGGGGGVFRLETMAPGMDSAQQSGGAGGAGGLTAPRKRKISTQALALGVLLALGGGMIYAMRLLGIGPLTTLAHTVLPDYDLTKPSSRAADHQKILQDLAANHAASQVPVDEVQKNPFRMSDVVSPVATSTPSGDPSAASRAAAERARHDAELKRGRVESALAQLKVNGIIGGSNPVARISGEAVRVGDTVGEIFTVTAIHGRGVELTHEGATYELSMDDQSANSTKPKKK